MHKRLGALLITAAAALTGCAWSYDGTTNIWRDRNTGQIIGCSEQEDDPIVPCPTLPAGR